MSEKQVILYSDAEYRGTSKTLGVGRYPTNIGLSNDSLSSLRIPTGLKVSLCEHGNFGGRRCILVRDTPHLGGVNDETTSLIIEEDTTPAVIVYSDSNFQGWSAEVQVGAQAAIGAGNDLVSSVIVPSGFRVTLYADGPFQGKIRELTSDAATLGDFNDKTSSIIVDRLTDRTPTLDELKSIIARVGPRVYFHPDDSYLPSSVEWFLSRATLHGSDSPSRPAAPTSGPLPTGGSGNDGAYWLDGDSNARGGDLGSAVAYVNAKFQNHWLDIQFWIFYPYNGAGTARLKTAVSTSTLNLDPMGQHGGDWEHVTCRVEPVSGQLRAIYMAQHDGGEWVGMGAFQTENGRPELFASRNGHASYPHEGSNLSNKNSQSVADVQVWEIGLLNSTDKGSRSLNCGTRYQILRADFLTSGITAPQWTEYCRRWGAKRTYSTTELKSSIKSSVGSIPYAGEIVDAIWGAIPSEAKEENGPTGPWMKGQWTGNE